MSKLSSAPGATPHTPSSVTTTTTASLSLDISARAADGIGLKEGPFATFPSAVDAGRIEGGSL